MSPKQFLMWSSAHSPAAHRSYLNSASENVWNRRNVCSPMLFIFTNTISFYTAGGKEKETKNICICFNQLLPNVKNWKGKIDFHRSCQQQQWDEMNYEGKHCPLVTSVGAKTKACSRVCLSPLSQRYRTSLTLDKMAKSILYAKNYFNLKAVGHRWAKSSHRRKITQCGHGILYHKTGY